MWYQRSARTGSDQMPIAVSRKGGDALYVASGAPLPPFRYEEFGVPDMTVSCSYIPVAGAASPGACSGRCAIFQLPGVLTMSCRSSGKNVPGPVHNLRNPHHPEFHAL
jgi:hypothetical protein